MELDRGSEGVQLVLLLIIIIIILARLLRLLGQARVQEVRMGISFRVR